MQTLIPLLVGIPALSAVILLLGGRFLGKWGHWLGVLAPAT